MMTRSLQFRNNPLAAPQRQLEILEKHGPAIPTFEKKLADAGLAPLTAGNIEIFQINIGKMCNQACAHCHVDAGPDRREIMTRQTMEECLAALAHLDVHTVDITGGAPEMNPDFRWLVAELHAMCKHIMVRCNLTIVVANPKYRDLPEFYRRHNVEVTASLPFYRADRTDRQRGEGVFEDSIAALRLLNDAGYGKPDSDLILNLVYNPAGAFLPGSQQQMENDFKRELKKDYNIDFTHLFCITNMPISRYLEYLIDSGNYDRYMDRLVTAFNPAAALNVMCRNTLSVRWDGYLYDCDFNQMLDIKLHGVVNHIRNFDSATLAGRRIRVNQHCYGCTAGSGSSCGGSIAP
jgi:radical SAM/Cys-rich protein